MRFLLLSLPLLSVAASADAEIGGAPFTIVESGGRYAHLQQAVDAIGEGRGTISIAPGLYRECAVQNGGDIRYGAASPGTVVFSGGICEGKAALVLHGRSASVDGMIFEKMAVPDGNGAGIRLETGNLSIDNSVFRQSQQGLLTASFPSGSITITRSTFSGLGTCAFSGGCAHSIYVGDYGSLTINRSRFEAGTGGHYVKSRAPVVQIVDNSFDDSRGEMTNYMIDLPNGARGRISGNEMVQGRSKDNYSAFIALGAEEAEHSSDGLAIAGNGARFVPGVDRNSAFLADWTGAAVALGVNDLAPGIKKVDRR